MAQAQNPVASVSEEVMMATAKMRHCFNCGAELGFYSEYHPLDTCGKQECERAARKAMQQEEDEDFEQFLSRHRR